MREKAQVEFISSANFIEGYNSFIRATVDKKITEKYARKLIQDRLSNEFHLSSCTVNKLYVQENGTTSETDNGWVFGITIPNELIFKQADLVERLYLHSTKV